MNELTSRPAEFHNISSTSDCRDQVKDGVTVSWYVWRGLDQDLYGKDVKLQRKPVFLNCWWKEDQVGLILTAQLILLDFPGRYILGCWPAASAAVVWTQCWQCQQDLTALLASGCGLYVLCDISACQRCECCHWRRVGSVYILDGAED